MNAATPPCEDRFWHETSTCSVPSVGVHVDQETHDEYPVCPAHLRPRSDCPNPHGLDLRIECWSPGGPCRKANDPACDLCGECFYCAEVVR